MSPNGEPGAEAAGLPAAGTDQVQASTDVEAVTGSPVPEGTADPVGAQSDGSQVTTDDTGDTEPDAAAAAEAAVAADRADLEQYPEGVREHFKALPPARRRELYEAAEAHIAPRVKAEIDAANQRTDALQKANAEAEAKRQQILQSQGKFVGETAIELNTADGEKVAGPTYRELLDLQRTPRGRQQLWDMYGLSEDVAESVRVELEARRAMLDSSIDLHRAFVLSDLGAKFQASLAAIPGVDADAMVAGATDPGTVITRFNAWKDEKHAAEMADLKRGYDARINAHTANAEGMRGRVVAAESRRLPTGGRTGGGDAGALTMASYRAMTSEQRRALPSSEIDAMMARHRASQGQARV